MPFWKRSLAKPQSRKGAKKDERVRGKRGRHRGYLDMAYNTLKLEFEDEIATLTFNRPDRRNAISPELAEELGAALNEVEAGPARVLIVTGAGKAFCAGLDLATLQDLAERTKENYRLQPGGVRDGFPIGLDANIAEARRIARTFRRLYEFSKPTIAAVNGAAIAGGCGLATLCDLTLAAPEAKFGYTEVKIGFMPAVVSVFLIRQIGEKRARDLLLTGRVFGAEEALRLGLVNEIVPGGRLMARAREIAEGLLEVSPSSLAFTKRLIHDLGREELLGELELAAERSARIRFTSDFHEGLAAFLEKRKPVWKGE